MSAQEKKQVKLLDCTLRDGGYVNDWAFGHDNLVSIFERLADSGVDIIEVGFLDDRRPFDLNRSIMPDTESVEKIFGMLDRKNSMVVGMIDYGTCDISNIQPCSESYLDGIRVIFKKHLRKQALEYCAQIKALGYKVFAQLVSVTSYSDEEMLDLIRLANEVEPYAVSMVDTYGLMHQNNLSHYFDILDANLKPGINLGYHAHNNFQMGYANCIAMLAKNTDREILVDGSLYGMGKSAGNAPIELIAMHMNHVYGKQYKISQMLEAIDANVLQFYKPATWGYNMFYYLAAFNDCHPSYVQYLMDKRTLSVKSINDILGSLQGEKKLLYDKNYIEELYKNYQTVEVNDEKALAELSEQFHGKKILLIGPGKSVVTQAEKIQEFHRSNQDACVISINHIPDCTDVDYVFISNAKRYVQLASRLANGNYKIIATSNITAASSGEFSYVLNYGNLIDADTEIADNSLIMIMKAFVHMGVGEVVMAGFDGYSASESNYYHIDMEYAFIKDKAAYLNDYTKGMLAVFRKSIKINFLTESLYE